MVQTIEQVVLLSDDGEAIGTADKATVHTEDTPLHLAFSCHVFDDEGRMLVTRRALHKRTWPGVWTNSFCGHPAPGEDIVDAVHRRAADELGMTLEDVEPVLPDFRYLAVDASGIVENEVCPVYTARVSGSFDPHRDEVMEWRWVDPADLRVAVSAASWAFSPWLALQLDRLHPDPAQSVPAL
ncbi:isopentenyl-diphosphate Delta-isomerase [Cnuibacter physcomitrellae]|uniref:isopentenyl-diphosphate Delta-isomerase n=1 Tax=Cnuibacter physcomitrellae TaxID=1619308 RepID=UPI002175F7F5|nr:isopentenyl-diphosphate Delta-isomerase [Cnuibacter physcomitrellae]MCS5497613.1 isopentenyl-diphosphate Delta-isomerase [Cnuibacter physcomitrellae]